MSDGCIILVFQPLDVAGSLREKVSLHSVTVKALDYNFLHCEAFFRRVTTM
jgi:hypothetical protein